MGCNEYKDNRDSCAAITPSSCVPYTGYISDKIKDDFACKPNINDLFKKLQELIDKINDNLGDNSKLDIKCLKDDLIDEFTQFELNQIIINKLCNILDFDTDDSINSNDISLKTIAVSLLCLEDPACEPKTEYTVKELFIKLIGAYCSLLQKVTNIENILNI